MCSILGLVDFNKNFLNQKKNIYDLNKILSHRGPDDEGFFYDENVALAFNRLSIIDLEKGNQPIIFQDLISIFNGNL